MKKSVFVLFVLFVLCLMASFCIAADEDAFAFQDVFTWGMTQDEVIKNLPTRRYELERERKLDYVEVDDDRYDFEGISADLTFGFQDDALVVIELSFDTEHRGVSESAIMGAMEDLYGKAEDVTDMQIVDDLMKIADYDEIDLDVRRNDTVKQWALEDGTVILMKIETRDDDIDVVFFAPGDAK